MDVSGQNRYELLLFMEDESGVSAPVKAAIKKKQPSAPSAVKKTQQPQPQQQPQSNANSNTIKKSKNIAEKENTNDPRTGQKSKPNQGQGSDRKRSKGEPKSEDGNRQNNEMREQRMNRGFARDAQIGSGGDYGGNGERAPRYRENRIPQRNRFNDNGFRKREFDRQSGSDKTGVKSVDKRDGAGAHNWGSVKQEIDDINKTSTAEVESTLTDKEESGNDQSADPIPVIEEEEAKEMTLDEWKALSKQRAKPQFNIRKAGEGEDVSQWKKMIVLNKKKGNGDSEEELEYDPSMYPQRVGRLQRIVDIQFNFNDGRRGGFGKGRGRGNRDRGRIEGRGNNIDETRDNNTGRSRNFGEKQRNTVSNTLKVDDERQFPTLG